MIAVVTLFSTILTFNDFSIIWILTRGGPGNATDVLATLTYSVAIPGLELGKGVAVSVLMLPILVVFILFLNRFINRREEARMTVKTIAGRTVAQPSAQKRILAYRTQRIAFRTFGWLLLAVVLLIALFPLYFMTITAFHPPSLATARTPTLFTIASDPQAFRDLVHQYPYMTWMSNTVIVSVCSTILSVSFATFAAYSLSRLRYPGRQLFANAVSSSTCSPPPCSSSRSLSSARTCICSTNCPR